MFRLRPGEKNGFNGLLAILLLSALLPGLTGCSTVTTVTEATVKATRTAAEHIPYLGGPEVRLKRKAALIRFENETLFKQFPLEKAFQDMTVENLSRKCPKLLLTLPDDPDFPQSMADVPRRPSGTRDNMALMEIGRQFGLNAVITGGVLNLSLDMKEEGILWFRETEERLKIQFHVEVFDMETGAKIFDNRFIHEIEDLTPEEIQAYKEGRPALFEPIVEEIEDLSEDMAENMCDAVIALPWAGYVVSAVDDRVFMSFGADIGAKAGDIMHVYDKGETIESKAGQKFILPGKKIGEVEIVQVDELLCVGRLLSGEGVMAGSTVRLPR